MKKRITVKFLIELLFIAAIVFIYGCNEEIYVQETESNAPIINSFDPLTGEVGTLITVEGEFLKNIDSASIGDGLANISRIINDNKVVLEVIHESKSGKVKLRNSLGLVESAEGFTFEYVTPTVTEFPETGVINSDISFPGTDLHGITGVFFDDVEAIITYQKEDELAVTVPFVPNAEWVTVRLKYNTESGEEQIIKGPSYGFLVVKPPYSVTSWPTSALRGSQVSLLGQNINLTDSIFFGDVLAEVVTSAASFVTVLVPDFPERTFVTMRVVYFSDQEIVNTFETEIYPQFRKVFDTFEGGLDNMRFFSSNGYEENLEANGDDSLVAPEGNTYVHYWQRPTAGTEDRSNSVMTYFHYDEGEGNLINLGAFTDPVVHFYYNTKGAPTYLQLETKLSGTVYRVYTERLETNSGNDWDLYCYRLNTEMWFAGYDQVPNAGIEINPNEYEYFRINFKPAVNDTTYVNLDYVFISEGAISGALDLTNWSANSRFNPDGTPPPVVP